MISVDFFRFHNRTTPGSESIFKRQGTGTLRLAGFRPDDLHFGHPDEKNIIRIKRSLMVGHPRRQGGQIDKINKCTAYIDESKNYLRPIKAKQQTQNYRAQEVQLDFARKKSLS